VKDRPFFKILIAALLAAALGTALFQGKSIFVGKEAAKPRIIVMFKTMDFSVSFWSSVREGAELAGKEFGAEISIRGPWNEKDVDGQIAILRKAISENPDAIVLAAGDYNLLVPEAKVIRKKRIPLVCIDSFLNSDDANIKIGTDNYEAGQKCGAALMRYLSRGAKVAVISYIKGSSTAIDRESGVRDFLKGKVELLDTVYSNAESEKAYEEAKAIIARESDLGGIVALNEPTSLGVARALDESGKAGKIVLTSFDNSFGVLKYVERGIIRDTIVQKPFNMGYLGVKAARDLIDGQKLSRYVNTGSVDINRDTMFLPENQKLLFPVAGGQ
jgi:ribose transport system substrate-binding protein